MEYLYIGLGGILGSLSRYFIGEALGKPKVSFPIATFAVNVCGAFLLGLVVSSDMNRNVLSFLISGFLGSFTTFSAFMYESVVLIKDKKVFNAILYILITVILGVGGFIAGVMLYKANIIK